jgi:hypothetical protein
MHAYYLLFCKAMLDQIKTEKNTDVNQKGIKKALKNSGLVVISGLEPPTHGFSVRCSTN